jgi:adenylate cyclase
VPQYGGRVGWSGAAVRTPLERRRGPDARVVAHMRARGHSFEEVRRAVDDGRLAYAYTEELLTSPGRVYGLSDAARDTGLEPALTERIRTAAGFNPEDEDLLREEDVRLLRCAARAVEAGLPPVALLQMVRVYGQAIARIADAKVRLFHLRVHEPLMLGRRQRRGGRRDARSRAAAAPSLLPVMYQTHERYPRHFVEQDVVGHMEVDVDGSTTDLGRMKISLAFVARLAGEEE